MYMLLYAIEGNTPTHLLPSGSKYRKDLSEMATKKTNMTGTKTPVAEAVKTEAVKAAAEVKADAAKAVKAVEKVAEKAVEKVAEMAPAAKKPAAKKPAPAAKKPAAKKAAPAKKEAAKKVAPAQPDKFALADMVREKFAKKDVTKVNEKIAIEIKAYGDKEYYIYVLIDDGKVTVEPWGYIDNDVHIDMPIDDVVAVVNGKYDFVAKALSGDFYAIGSVTKLLKAYEALIK